MKYRDQINQSPDHKRWSQWTVRPETPKRKRKPTDYASAFVFVMSGLVASGIHQHLMI